MTKLIPRSDYTGGAYAEIWAEGYLAGQKSTFAPSPVSVTGRWWQAANGKVWFVHQEDYKAYQRAMDINPDASRWLTEETTIEF